MNSKISKLFADIDAKKEEIKKEYEKLRKKYDFSVENGRIKFSNKAKEYQKGFKVPLKDYAVPKSVRHFISMPFIYGMIIPGFVLDVGLFLYQQTAFRLYKIPLVKRSDYIVFDRRHLNYLNLIQKVNCLYCSYMNGLFSFAVEVGGRTEKYWCPIKAAKRKKGGHEWEQHFADYGDPEEFKKNFNSTKEYYKAKNIKKETV
ncbi:hypothetical protein GW846_02455 [Candidatus Gracilibacteria bacterium]|nr:hypothetical protein [Candidatus Gracilibacteria bacterium]